MQLKERTGPRRSLFGDEAQAVAQRGVSSGAGEQLPYLESIQTAFGAHDVTGVRAHVGGKASEAAGELGALAYATGNNVAFGSQPDLHTAAHEAAHVVQQRAGVHLKGGVGQAEDQHERHADAVADLVVQGKSAESLLGAADSYRHHTGAARGALQRKEDKGDLRSRDPLKGELSDSSSESPKNLSGATEELANFDREDTKDILVSRLAGAVSAFLLEIQKQEIKKRLIPHASVFQMAVSLVFNLIKPGAGQFAAFVGELLKKDASRVVAGGLVTTGLGAAESKMGSMAGSLKSTAARTTFLENLKDVVRIQADALLQEAFTLTDEGLAQVTAYWHPAFHRSSRFRVELESLLRAQALLEDIGVSSFVREVLGPDGQARVAHCCWPSNKGMTDVRRHLVGFISWVDRRFAVKAIDKERQRERGLSEPVSEHPSVLGIRWNDRQFVAISEERQAVGLASELPEMKEWIQASKPRFVRGMVDGSTQEYSEGGIEYPEAFDGLSAND